MWFVITKRTYEMHVHSFICEQENCWNGLGIVENNKELFSKHSKNIIQCLKIERKEMSFDSTPNISNNVAFNRDSISFCFRNICPVNIFRRIRHFLNEIGHKFFNCAINSTIPVRSSLNFLLERFQNLILWEHSNEFMKEIYKKSTLFFKYFNLLWKIFPNVIF